MQCYWWEAWCQSDSCFTNALVYSFFHSFGMFNFSLALVVWNFKKVCLVGGLHFYLNCLGFCWHLNFAIDVSVHFWEIAFCYFFDISSPLSLSSKFLELLLVNTRWPTPAPTSLVLFHLFLVFTFYFFWDCPLVNCQTFSYYFFFTVLLFLF